MNVPVESEVENYHTKYPLYFLFLSLVQLFLHIRMRSLASKQNWMPGHSVGNGNKLQILGYQGKGGLSSPGCYSFTSTQLLAAEAHWVFQVLPRRDVVSGSMCGWWQHPRVLWSSPCLWAFSSEVPRAMPAAAWLEAGPAGAQPQLWHHLKCFIMFWFYIYISLGAN